MTQTAIEAWYGGSATETISADYRMRVEFRLLDVAATTSGLKVKLPRGDLVPAGVQYVVSNRGANDVLVVRHDGATVANCPAGQVVCCLCTSSATTAGEWIVFSYASVQRGSAITLGREPWHLALYSGAEGSLNLRYELDRIGYQGTKPVSLVVSIGAGVERGIFTPSAPAVDSGPFPAGSTILLVNGGTIAGAGGNGGIGGGSGAFPDPAEAGGSGGIGLRLWVNTSIVNYGHIQGGGGGGGGGTGSASQEGGGGGGGYVPGMGGGVRGLGGGSPGIPGRLQAGGGGGTGANDGGSGGSPGTAGAAGGGSGGAGGAAGAAISSLASATVTIIRAGNILGPQVTFS